MTASDRRRSGRMRRGACGLTLRAAGLLVSLLMSACGRPTSPVEEEQGEQPGETFDVLFQSGFEEPDPFAGTWDPPFEQTPPGASPARVELVTEPTHSGERSVRAVAPPGGGGLNCGKASVGRKGLDVRMGDTVRYTAFYRLEQPLAKAAPQLMDIECASCSAGGPGVRVVTTAEGHIRIDWKFLNWYSNNGLPPPRDAPPRAPAGSFLIQPGTWFQLALRMVLGKGSEGLTEVYVNGALDSRIVGTNIAPDGLEVLDHYPQIQLGVTCLPAGNAEPASVYVDDVLVERTR